MRQWWSRKSKAMRQNWRKFNDTIGLGLLLFAIVLAIIIGILSACEAIDTASTLEIAALSTLVVVTMWYAKSTRKMAKEMEEQRYSESLPLLVPTIIPTFNTQGLNPNEVRYEYLETGIGIKVTWCNLGNGVAINLRFSLLAAPLDSSSGKAFFLAPPESGSLGVGGQKEIDFSETAIGKPHDVPNTYRPRLEAEYQDIYERHITTVQEFRFDAQNRTASLGDLYFIVDGKRLGEEMSQHD